MYQPEGSLTLVTNHLSIEHVEVLQEIEKRANKPNELEQEAEAQYALLTEQEVRIACFKYGIKAKDITPEDFEIRKRAMAMYRARIKINGKWTKEKHREANRKARHLLYDSYIIRLIRYNKSYDGHEITQEEIKEKREEIQNLRNSPEGSRKIEKPTLRKSEEHHREKERLRLEQHKVLVASLTDDYVKERIRKSTRYKGEEITDEMIYKKRKEIQELRERREQGLTGIVSSYKLTDAYIIRCIKSTPRYRGVLITQELIDEVKARILKRREKKPVQKYTKK